MSKKDNQISSNKPVSEDDLYNSDRGERKYYLSKGKSLSERVRLPLTKDGCETILEMVSSALDLPLTDKFRQDFCGWVHHLPMNENSFTFGELGKIFWGRFSKQTTWQLDQEAKERMKAEADKAKLETEKASLTLAKDAASESKETPAVQ